MNGPSGDNRHFTEATRMTPSKKGCAICGNTYPLAEFAYGNRENNSYCRTCRAAHSAAYTRGGRAATQKFRDEMRAKWQQPPLKK